MQQLSQAQSRLSQLARTTGLLGLLLALVLTSPLDTLGQQIDETIDDPVIVSNPVPIDADRLTSLSTLLSTKTTLDDAVANPAIVLNEQDWRDWQNLEGKDLSIYDKRIMTGLLPGLVNEVGPGFEQVVVDRVRRGYTDETTAISRKLPDSTNISQHYYGKAVSLTSLGTTRCQNGSAFFPQLIDAKLPVWVHWQTGEADKQTVRWPLARSFDGLIKHIFWLEGRALTETPIAAETWSDFLIAIAKSELEQRFGLRKGSLNNVPIDDLDVALASGRLATALGLTDLPIGTTKAELFESIGRRKAEVELNLPIYAFEGTTWTAIYRTIGQRVLEHELGLPDVPISSLVTADNSTDPKLAFGGEARFGALADAIGERQNYYSDLRVALNLPVGEYLASSSGLAFPDRLLLGDAGAFTTLGAYFLADSLDLSPGDTKTLVENLDNDQTTSDRVINLKTARPIDPAIRPETLFNLEVSDQPKLFESIGQQAESTISSHLPRLNEDVLQAMKGNNKIPELGQIISTLSNAKGRQAILTKIASASIADANYQGNLTKAALQNRGRALFAGTIGLSPDAISRVEQSKATPIELEQTVSTVADAMGWPSPYDSRVATTDKTLIEDLLGSVGSSLAPNATIALKRRLLTAGAHQLWNQLDIPKSLVDSLDRYFFLGQALATPARLPSTSQGTSDSDEGETIPDDFFSSIETQAPVIHQISQATSLPEADITYFFTGQMRPALIRATAALVGRELNDAGTMTPAEVIKLLDTSATDLGNQLVSQPTAPDVLGPTFLDLAKKAIAADDPYKLWDAFQGEMVYQWNMACQDKQTLAETAISRLISYLISLPDSSQNQEDVPTTRPVQIMTLKGSAGLAGGISSKIKEAYPNADGENYKYGLYAFARGWDNVYIAY